MATGRKRATSGAPLALEKTGWFRFRHLPGDRVVLTNDIGDYSLLTRDEFDGLIRRGEVPADEATVESLRRNGFLLDLSAEHDLVERLRRKKHYLFVGPSLHIIVLTLRCDHACVYCHASTKSMESSGVDLDLETARRVVDTIFETSSPSLTIEFQGGEPLANWPVLTGVIEYALELNRSRGKSIVFSLVTGCGLMDEEKLAYLLDHKVQVCVSFDGPEFLHNANRTWRGADSHANTVRWIKAINDGYLARGFAENEYRVNALFTATREALKHPREVIDEYVRQGLHMIHLRPLNPYGFARRLHHQIGYTLDEFLAFYFEALEYVFELNRSGVRIMERTAQLYLSKIFNEYDPNFMELRSPCGAAIGQLAYNYDGRIFTCDEGRMLDRMGDDMFCIGDVRSSSFAELLGSDKVAEMCVASCQEAITECVDCAYQPYCGACPVFNYVEQGSLFGQTATNDRCRTTKAVCDHLFGKLASGDKNLLNFFDEWVTVKFSEKFVQKQEPIE